MKVLIILAITFVSISTARADQSYDDRACIEDKIKACQENHAVDCNLEPNGYACKTSCELQAQHACNP